MNVYRSAKEQLKESERHNKVMESTAVRKGLYLAPYKTGSGLFLNQYPPVKGKGLKKTCSKKKKR